MDILKTSQTLIQVRGRPIFKFVSIKRYDLLLLLFVFIFNPITSDYSHGFAIQYLT